MIVALSPSMRPFLKRKLSRRRCESPTPPTATLRDDLSLISQASERSQGCPLASRHVSNSVCIRTPRLLSSVRVDYNANIKPLTAIIAHNIVADLHLHSVAAHRYAKLVLLLAIAFLPISLLVACFILVLQSARRMAATYWQAQTNPHSCLRWDWFVYNLRLYGTQFAVGGGRRLPYLIVVGHLLQPPKRRR